MKLEYTVQITGDDYKVTLTEDQLRIARVLVRVAHYRHVTDDVLGMCERRCNKVVAIKAIRELFGLGLREAKFFTEDLIAEFVRSQSC